MRPVWIVVVMGVSSTSRAEPYASVQVRDDAEHPLRVGGGIAVRGVMVSALVDPQAMIDGLHVGDVAVGARLGPATLALGWRNTAIPFAGGIRFYESAVIAASLPVVQWSRFTLCVGVEVSALMVAHGTTMPVQWISGDTWQRSLTTDLFIQVRYGR